MLRRICFWAAMCISLVLFACGGSDSSNDNKANAPADAAKESFASLKGTATNLIIAVGPGSRVRAYACDGDSTALWWTGDSSGDTFKATSSDGGATLTAKLGDTVKGTITFKDGKSIDFSTKATTGAQGLYSVELLADGKMTGTSLGGNKFAGQFDFKGNTLAGDVTLPAGKTIKISAKQSKTGGSTSPGSYLAVLDAKGQAKGFQLRSPGKPADGFVAGWVMP